MAAESSWPSADRAIELHARLSASDPVAPSDLAVAFLDVLAAWVTRTNPRVDLHLCDQAAEDAILSLIKNPRSYNPERGSLDAYLRMSATGDLRNLLDREKHHRSRLQSLGPVELPGDVRNQVWEEGDPAVIVELAEELKERAVARQPVMAGGVLTQEDTRVLTLMQQGERKTAEFALALGISDLPPDQQRREVKRAKDRLKQRLKRARGNHDPAN
jgi:hypothetical protein